MLERLHFVLGGCVGEGTQDSDRIYIIIIITVVVVIVIIVIIIIIIIK